MYYYGSGGTKPHPPIDKGKIIHVQGNFCNLVDKNGMPIFDPFIDWLIANNPSLATDWAARIIDNDGTHINLDISGDYNEPLGWAPRYPIPGTDWTNNLEGFKYILDWVLDKNLIPIIHLAADGDSYDPNGMTYGINWAYKNLPSIIGNLHDYHLEALWNPGWDGCFANNGWTPDSTVAFLHFLRNLLGDEAAIAMEFNGPGSVGYCHLGNGPADWTPDRLGILDAFFIELNVLWPNADLTEGVIETATRLLGPKALNAPTSPYYLSGLSKEVAIIFFETCAYQAIRKQIDSHYAREIASFGKNYGFQYFGNGLPL